jgi:hypothetical protein
MDNPKFPDESFLFLVAALAIIGALTLITLALAGIMQLFK